MKHVTSPSELEPVRLLAGGTARERRLLEAAADDVMPAATPERLEQALAAWAAGGAVAAGGAEPAGRASEPTRSALGARLGRWGIVGGLGGVAMVAWVLGPGPDPVAPELPVQTVVPVEVTPEAVNAAPVVAQPSPPVVPVETKPLRRTSHEPRKPMVRPDRASSSGNLLEEARRLDAVRSALDARNGATARRELSDYHARFPRGELSIEADVLEADLLLFSGEPERARALANTLLARPDAGRYRQRLEQFLQRARAASRGSNRASTHMVERR